MGNRGVAPELVGTELAAAIESVIGHEGKEKFVKRAKEVRDGLESGVDGFDALEGGRKRAARLIIKEAGLV
jgi:hypothetical protein